MKKIITRRVLTWFASLLIGMNVAIAQAPGSEAIYGGSFSTLYVGGYHINNEETLYIGPGTHIIDGIWEIYSKFIVIDPNANISGTGVIKIFNPVDAGGISSRTYIDGNDNINSIEVNIELLNSSGMEIYDKNFPVDLIDFTNVPKSTVYIGKDLNLAVDGADIWLDADAIGDLRFDNNSTISNYSEHRMIITNNSIISHVVRDAGSTGFFFPIGIDDGDYTPAMIAGTENYHVSVQNYDGSLSNEFTFSEGMDRTWHIFGGAASVLTLQHNVSTNGADYVDADAFITQFAGGGLWSTGTPEQVSSGVHSNSTATALGIPATAVDGAYFSKSSEPITPLPVKLAFFTAIKQASTVLLDWSTLTELNNKGFEIERSTDSRTWSNIGFVNSKAVNGNSSSSISYEFTDYNPENGVNYYRLKQVDWDGKIEYSEVKLVVFNGDYQLRLYPNPASNNINIAGLIGNERIVIYDMTGRKMSEFKADKSTYNIEISKFSKGTYVVQIINQEGNVQNFKFIKNDK